MKVVVIVLLLIAAIYVLGIVALFVYFFFTRNAPRYGTSGEFGMIVLVAGWPVILPMIALSYMIDVMKREM